MQSSLVRSDISKPINYISAKQIKQITNEDARLMAKIDKIENLPKVFRENNLFILPVSRCCTSPDMVDKMMYQHA